MDVDVDVDVDLDVDLDLVVDADVVAVVLVNDSAAGASRCTDDNYHVVQTGYIGNGSNRVHR